MKALRYFRAVSAALLKRFLSSGPKTFEEIDEYLAVARLHPTGRHWVDNFILPTLLIHQFERAEREGDYYSKQLTMERTLKYFFLAGHVQYPVPARDAPSARHLPAVARRDLVSGTFVCRHHEGYWNAVSGDQFGEQTAIRMDKGALKVPSSPLPKRDAIMKSKNNKRKLASILPTFTVGDMTTTESRDDSAFDHDEADITMISYVIEAAKCGKDVIRVLSDDTDVLVLLVYWVYREEMTSKVQMERCDGT